MYIENIYTTNKNIYSPHFTPLKQESTPHFKVYTDQHLEQIEALRGLDKEQRFAMQVVSKVLPFRVNQFVIDHLIDWSCVPEDPIFQLTFPQREMLHDAHFGQMAALIKNGADKQTLRQAAHEIRQQLNPHPAGQSSNVPSIEGRLLAGMQHKYRETLLFFPSQGQTCHSYCSFCFRWPQFTGDKELRFSAHQAQDFHAYLKQHQDISDVLITGGDPMVMKATQLASYVRPLLEPAFDHIQTIRIGTKSLSFWPYRYLTDPDADELLRLLEELVLAGKNVAIMAHVNHWRELEPPATRRAISRIRATGALIRSQAPLLAHVNDHPQIWAQLWRTQVQLGLVPYYMFVERDTGAKRYFEVPLVRAWEIYRDAIKQVSGLARTARGPSMSTLPGKVEVLGVEEIHGEKVFVLRFIQGRNPEWVMRPFFARFDPKATWLTQLQPAFGADKFFFED